MSSEFITTLVDHSNTVFDFKANIVTNAGSEINKFADNFCNNKSAELCVKVIPLSVDFFFLIPSYITMSLLERQ